MGDSLYKVRRFRPADRPDLIELMDKVWNEDAAKRLALLWDWKYDRNPHNPPTGHGSIVLEYDGRAVGWIGFVRAKIKVGDQIVPLAWGSDLSVHPDHRGRGYLVLKYITEHGEWVTAGGSIPEKIYQIYKRLGAIDATRFVSCKQVLNTKNFLRAKGLRGVKVLLGRPALRAADIGLRILRWRSDLHRITVTPISAFDERFDALWERVSGEYGLLTVRDRAFLNWRFIDCPNRSYECLAAERGGELVGYVVFRSEDDGELRHGYVVDLLTGRRDHAAFQRLLDAAERLARERGCDTLGFTTSLGNRELIEKLKRHGMIFQTAGRKVIAHGGGPEGFRHLMPLFQNSRCFHLTRADSDSDYSYDSMEIPSPEAAAEGTSGLDPGPMAPDPV